MYRVMHNEVEFCDALKGSLKKDLSSFLLRKNACVCNALVLRWLKVIQEKIKPKLSPS